MPASPMQAYIVIEAPNGDVREVVVGRVSVVIGRDESADIRVNDKKVSRRHVAFRYEDGRVQVEDLGSVNGIKLNGRRVDKSEVLGSGDIVQFGGYQVTLRPTESEANSMSSEVSQDPIEGDSISEELYAFLEPRMDAVADESGVESVSESMRGQLEPLLTGMTPPVQSETFVLQLGENILGRLEDCDVPILHESISRQHARISVEEGRTTIEDLQSSNGTFINDDPVKSGDLQHGDVVRVGSVKFNLRLPSKFANVQGATRKRSVNSKSNSLMARHSAAIFPTLILMAILVAGVSWFVQAEKPFTVLSQLFDSEESPNPEPPNDQESESGVAVKSELGTEADSDIEANSLREDDVSSPNELDTGETKTETKISFTSTSPFGPRDDQGWPLRLPKVDSSFQFDEFVTSQLEEAERYIEAEDYSAARKTLSILRAKDPINSMAIRLGEKLVQQEDSSERFRQATEMEQQGKLGKSLALYQSLAKDPKFSEQAQSKIENQLPRFLELELTRAEKAAQNSKTWLRAHEKLMVILNLDPKNEKARELIWRLEKDMRAKRLRFEAYVDKRVVAGQPPPQSSDQVMAEHAGDRALLSALSYYQKGDYKRALRSAQRKSKEGSKQAKDLVSSLQQAKKKYERVRTALGNDPSEAWFYLREFNKQEGKILPENIKSFWRKELEASIADAYAEQGEAMFVQQRYEEAFTKWDAGAKLRPRHVKIEAGFLKLEVVANTMKTEAELLMQQAKPGACDRWRRITRMTRSDTETHILGRRMANQVCN